MAKKITLAQEYQQLAYGLFQAEIFSMSGLEMESEQGVLEDYIPKSEVIEKSIKVLNELGRLMASDSRLKEDKNEIDSDENNPVS